MKVFALTFGCGLVTLFVAGVALLSAVLLFNRSERVSYAGTPTGISKIGTYTPAPIPFTPQPVISWSTATPSNSLEVASTSGGASTSTPTPVVPTATATATEVTVSQAESTTAETASATTLPDRQPEAMGPLNRREDNSIFINAGMNSSSTVEVVVTDDTVIYRDNSEMSQPGAPGGTPPADMTPPGGSPPGNGTSPGNGAPPGNMSPPGEMSFAQLNVEQVSSLDEISGKVMIFAWGEREDNQVVAQILVYHLLNE